MSHHVDPDLSEEEPLSSVALDSGLASPPEEREPQLETLTTILERIQETLGPSSRRRVPLGNPNFAEFTGQDMEDVNKWLARMELHFAAQGARADQCVPFASQYLKGIAWDWFLGTYRRLGAEFLQWRPFKSAIKERFQVRDDDLIVRDKLHVLRHKGTISEYVQEFYRLLHLLPRMDERECLHRFLTGLKRDYALYVRGHRPRELEGAIILARDFEALQTPYGHPSNAKSSERMDRIKKRLCFHCGKPGHLARDCPLRNHEVRKAENTGGQAPVQEEDLSQ